MLPFLKNRKEPGMAGVTTLYRKKDEDAKEDNMHESGIRAAAKDLCDAIRSEDYDAAAKALRAAFEIFDSEPHSEGPHINE
jgi:hypothetical protein